MRQLENLCRRLAVMAPGREILAADLPLLAVEATPAGDDDWTTALRRWTRHQLETGSPKVAPQARALFDQALLEAALELTGGHRQQAAARLGLGRNTITRKLGATRRRRPPLE